MLRAWILAAVFAGLLGAMCCQGASNPSLVSMLEQGWSMDNGVFPLYTDPPRQLEAVVRLDNAFLTYERRGFFHIGLLPAAEVDNAKVEIPDPAHAAEAMLRLRGWLGGRAASRVAFHGIRLTCGGTNVIEAGSLRRAGLDQWELAQGVRFVSGGENFESPKALLTVAGPGAGEIVFETKPRMTRVFFSPSSNQN